MMNMGSPPNHWHEETSKRYLDYGCYFVPAGEQQMHIMVDLLRGLPSSSLVHDWLVWREQAGLVDIGVHFFQAGHALFSGWKKDEKGKQEGKC